MMSCHRDTQSTTVKPGKDPSEPINNSLIYHILLPRAAKILRRWRTPLAPRVLALTPNHILKYGYGTRLSEAHAMEYISRNTSVPVPRIISCFQSKGGNPYILMTRCPGIPLCNVFREFSLDEKKDVLAQLRGFMDELRALTPPKPGWVGSTDYTSIDDERVHSLPCGPFESVRDFHRSIRDAVESPSGIDELDQMISMQDGGEYQIKFTHGDLSFRNILCDRGKITGIVDWESAGWYPHYWEYAMTWDSFWDNRDLRDCIREFLEPFPDQLNMEQTRRKLFRGD